MHWSILAACWPLSMPAQGRHPSASSKHNEKHLQLLPITPGWDHWFKRTQISPFLFYNTPLLNGHSHWLGFVKFLFCSLNYFCLPGSSVPPVHLGPCLSLGFLSGGLDSSHVVLKPGLHPSTTKGSICVKNPHVEWFLKSYQCDT